MTPRDTLSVRVLRAMQHQGALTAEDIGDLLGLPHHSASHERNQLSRQLRRLVKSGELAKTPAAGLGAPSTYRFVPRWLQVSP